MAFYLIFTSIFTPLDFLPMVRAIRLTRASNRETKAGTLDFCPLVNLGLISPHWMQHHTLDHILDLEFLFILAL